MVMYHGQRVRGEPWSWERPRVPMLPKLSDRLADVLRVFVGQEGELRRKTHLDLPEFVSKFDELVRQTVVKIKIMREIEKGPGGR